MGSVDLLRCDVHGRTHSHRLGLDAFNTLIGRELRQCSKGDSYDVNTPDAVLNVKSIVGRQGVEGIFARHRHQRENLLLV